MGAVGTGKSSVLAALLGELEKTGGRIALDRPPQGTRAAPQGLIFSFRKLRAAFRIQAGRNCPPKKRNFEVFFMFSEPERPLKGFKSFMTVFYPKIMPWSGYGLWIGSGFSNSLALDP